MRKQGPARSFVFIKDQLQARLEILRNRLQHIDQAKWQVDPAAQHLAGAAVFRMRHVYRQIKHEPGDFLVGIVLHQGDFLGGDQITAFAGQQG
ncbi:hypothetical protein D3C86_1868980 [compost metagenome]